MKIRKNGKVIKLTESDLRRIVKNNLLKEETEESHNIVVGESYDDRSLQDQINWINSGMNELSNTVSRILRHLNL